MKKVDIAYIPVHDMPQCASRQYISSGSPHAWLVVYNIHILLLQAEAQRHHKIHESKLS